MRIETRNLRRTYVDRKRVTVAVSDADIYIEQGETVGLWGQSGSGKSTMAKMLCGLERPESGEILIDGKAIGYPFERDLYDRIQIIFQHPEVSFNPRLTLEKSLMEPYVCHRMECSREHLLDTMFPFGLYAEHLKRYPNELSGGELQRAAIVRALVLEPEFLILDEPTSMLDSISQAQMMNLFDSIQKKYDTSFLLISHNRALAEAFCDRIYAVNEGVFSYMGEGRR